VALNKFSDDMQEDLNRIIKFCESLRVQAVVANHFEEGGKGAIELAKAVLDSIVRNSNKSLKFLYPLDASFQNKIETLAREIYGAKGVEFDRRAETDMDLLNENGYGHLPICIAKTPKSLSDIPKIKGRPSGFKITVNELRISAGAGFAVVICGNIMTMPGLPKEPAALRIKVLPDGKAVGLS
jgi:formate--tetrahydrofolate ligase